MKLSEQKNTDIQHFLLQIMTVSWKISQFIGKEVTKEKV